MELFKQSKKYDFRIYLKYDRFGEPYWSIENYKSTFIKENLSFRYSFDKIIELAKKHYLEEIKEETPLF